MIRRLVYNNKPFKILNGYGFKNSNSEVTFNDISIDFTGCTIADIPFKYQEIKIMELENEENLADGYILFTGFLDDINLSNMKLKQEYRELKLTLLSPLKMATKRNVSLIGTFDVSTAILRVLHPLINDGFTVKEFHITEGQITTNFVLETIENCMNNICSKRNILWYINERKEIFINSIDYLFGLSPKKTIKSDIKETNLLKIQPTIANVDYANVINFKNVRIIYQSIVNQLQSANEYFPFITSGKIVKKGDIVSFDYPLIVDENTLRDYIQEEGENSSNYYSISLDFQLSNSTYKHYDIGIALNEDNIYKKTGSITFSNDDGEEGELVLQRDSFFSNLITGFKWNVDSNATIIEGQSDTALRYTTMRFMYSAEIDKLKGIISNTGQIEKVIDYNNAWTTIKQLVNYARSLIMQNSNVVNQVELAYDVNQNLNIGDIVEIDEPDFYIQGKFAVKDINYTFKNKNEQIWQITLKNTDLISTYIDIFRPKEHEENENNINTVILSEFVEEKLHETHSIEIEE